MNTDTVGDARSGKRKHIDAVGPDRFYSIKAAAVFAVRADARFIGADKIRDAIAEGAALKATGYSAGRNAESYTLPNNQPHTSATEELYAKALEAARKAAV